MEGLAAFFVSGRRASCGPRSARRQQLGGISGSAHAQRPCLPASRASRTSGRALRKGRGPASLPARAIADAHGFVERNPAAPRKRRKGRTLAEGCCIAFLRKENSGCQTS